MGGRRCGHCGGRLVEDALTGLKVCEKCHWGFMESGREICPPCVAGECWRCVSWFDEDEVCDHECFYQAWYGPAEDVGYITPDDW